MSRASVCNNLLESQSVRTSPGALDQETGAQREYEAVPGYWLDKEQ